MGYDLSFMLITLRAFLASRRVCFDAARFTTGDERQVGQEPAPKKCVLRSTSRAIRSDVKGWVLSEDGDMRMVMLDHLDVT